MRRRFMVDWIVVVRAGVETEFVLIADDIFSRGRDRRQASAIRDLASDWAVANQEKAQCFFFSNLCR